MSNLWMRVGAATLALGLLAGCGTSSSTPSGSPAPATNAPKKTAATAAIAGDAVSLDPHDTNDNLSYGIENTVYQGLIGFDKDMKAIPVLAEAMPTVSADAKTFTFKLRQGIKFQDGEPLNAAAVKKSFSRVADPANKLKRNSLFSNIVSIDTPDDNTVVFHLKDAFGAMTYNFAHPAGKVIAPSCIDKGKDFLARTPVGCGTGPFTFKEWVNNDHITVTKNASYWDTNTAAKVDSITFKVVTEAGTRTNGLKSGDLDFVLPVPAVDAQAMKNDPTVKIQSAPSIYSFYMAMNTSKAPFNDIRVRQALNLAIDRKAIREGLLRGFAQPMTSYLPPQVSFYQKQGDEIARDVNKAKDLLKQANYDGATVEIWSGNTTERQDLANMIVQQLKEVGFNAKEVPMDSAALSAALWTQDKDHNKVQLYLGGWSTSTGDADWAIRPLLAGVSAPPNGYNVGFYNNPQVNDLINKGLMEADSAKRAQIYGDLQKALWTDMPWVPLYVPDNIWGTGPKVSGVFVQGDGIVNYNGFSFN